MKDYTLVAFLDLHDFIKIPIVIGREYIRVSASATVYQVSSTEFQVPYIEINNLHDLNNSIIPEVKETIKELAIEIARNTPESEWDYNLIYKP